MASESPVQSTRVTKAELARLTGRSRQAIDQLAKRHVFPVGSDGLVDRDLAVHAIANRVRPRMSRRQAELAAPPVAPTALAALEVEAPLGYNEAKTLREIAEARLAELRLAEQRGELVRAVDVQSALSNKAAALREGFLQLPARLAPIMAAESDQARCHDILQAELRQVLEQLTNGGGAW
jgi:phage terminase Nu1 subunit (DNA packaging protein)